MKRKRESKTIWHYELYQLNLREDPSLLDRYGRSTVSLKKQGYSIDPKHYQKVYQGQVEGDTESVLDRLFSLFTVLKPFDDYQGMPMAVSDIVVLRRFNKRFAFYCDDFGFEKLSGLRMEEFA